MSTEGLPVIQLDAPSSQTMPSSGGGFRSEGGVAQAPATTRAVSAEIMGGAPTNFAPAAPAPVERGIDPMEAPPTVFTTPGRTSMPKGVPVPAKELSLADSVEKALAEFEGSAAPAPAPAQTTQTAEPEKPGTPGDPAAPAKPAADPNAGDPTGELGLDTDVDTTGWTTQAARAFERVKGQRKQLLSEREQLQAQINQYESQMQELKGSLQASGSVEELQERVKEFEQQQMFTNLEGTRVYQEVITTPLQNCMTTIDTIAERAGVSGDILFDIMMAPEDPDNLPETDADGFPYKSKDQRIEALLASATPRDRATLFNTMNEMEALMAKRASMYQKADQAFREAQELENQRAQYAAAEEAKYRRKVSATVVARITERVPFLNEMPGLDLTKVTEEVGSVNPKALHPVDAQYYAATAKLFPHVVNDLMRAQAEIEDLVSRLAAYEEAEPGAGVGSSTGFVGGGTRGAVPYGNPNPDATFAQSVELALANMRG